MADPTALLRLALRTAPTTSDADLLRRFTEGRDGESFAALVDRHGPAVYRVCQRLVGPADADDAFQATFLILATRPGSVRKAGSVGSWLVGVAGRVAGRMRRSHARRRRYEAVAVADQRTEHYDHELAEQARVLDEELARLPDRLRYPVVACLLQGRTHDETAAEAGTCARTVRRRLDEAKRLLKLRLERRGVAPAVAAGLTNSVSGAATAAPCDLAPRTVATVLDFLAGGPAVSAPPAILAKGVAMETFARKCALLLATAGVALTALGVGVADDGPPPAEPPKPATAAATPAPPLRVATEPAPPTPVAPAAAPLHASVAELLDRSTFRSRAVLGEAAHQQRVLRELWFGREAAHEPGRPLFIIESRRGESVPPPPSGVIPVLYITDGTAGSSSTFEFAQGRLERAWVDLAGPLEQVLEDQLPRQMTHLVLADRLGRPVPRWVEAAAALSESAGSQARYDRRCRELLNSGRAVRLSALFRMTEYPDDASVVTAQGHSVARFLLTRKGEATVPVLDDVPFVQQFFRIDRGPHAAFVSLIRSGADGDWDRAVKAVYGFADVDALEQAWVEWMKTPASRVVTGPPVQPVGKPAPAPPTPLIPPVKLPDGR